MSELKTYSVTFRETRTLTTEVEASDEESAGEIAAKLYYGWSVDEIDVEVEEVVK